MLQFHEDMESEYTLVSPTIYHNLFFASNSYNLHFYTPQFLVKTLNLF